MTLKDYRSPRHFWPDPESSSQYDFLNGAFFALLEAFYVAGFWCMALAFIGGHIFTGTLPTSCSLSDLLLLFSVGFALSAISGFVASLVGVFATLAIGLSTFWCGRIPSPAIFASMAVSLAVLPVSYTLFTISNLGNHPVLAWLTLIGTVSTAAGIGNLYAKKKWRRENAGQRPFRFQLKAMFVLTTWFALVLLIDNETHIVLKMLLLWLSINAVTIFVFNWLEPKNHADSTEA